MGFTILVSALARLRHPRKATTMSFQPYTGTCKQCGRTMRVTRHNSGLCWKCGRQGPCSCCGKECRIRYKGRTCKDCFCFLYPSLAGIPNPPVQTWVSEYAHEDMETRKLIVQYRGIKQGEPEWQTRNTRRT
ncbi:hypothetical protein BMAGN_1547 [Bifidobacterium magnum]|uniref:Uncharacterized protein n=1 Tax=Bifidobacterium magnum TaxID=1692 RepID=A0A087B9N7_9BIFI|nr:hypothetical protein BMAGN_1547 [Bifidobacterium magnum]